MPGERTRCKLVIMTGGGPGIMEAANRGAFEVGGKSVGLNIDLPHEQEPNPYITPELCFQFHYFAMRKFHFILRAAALVVFPGGFGTLDELFETLCLRQTRRMQQIPVILYGRKYWDSIIDFQRLADEGVVDDEDLKLIELRRNAARSLEHHRQISRVDVSSCEVRICDPAWSVVATRNWFDVQCKIRTTRRPRHRRRRPRGARDRPRARRAAAIASPSTPTPRSTRLKQLVDELHGEDHAAAAFGADLRDEDATRAMIDRARRHFGRLDALVNNAATWSPTPLEITAADDVRRFFEVNTLSTFVCCQHAGLIMAEQDDGGAIVNIGDWAVAAALSRLQRLLRLEGSDPHADAHVRRRAGAARPRERRAARPRACCRKVSRPKNDSAAIAGTLAPARRPTRKRGPSRRLPARKRLHHRRLPAGRRRPHHRPRLISSKFGVARKSSKSSESRQQSSPASKGLVMRTAANSQLVQSAIPR